MPVFVPSDISVHVHQILSVDVLSGNPYVSADLRKYAKAALADLQFLQQLIDTGQHQFFVSDGTRAQLAASIHVVETVLTTSPKNGDMQDQLVQALRDFLREQ